MSVIVDVADAVVVELTNHQFSMPFTAVRGYVPSYDLKELKALKVTVVPRALTLEPITRTTTDCKCLIDVAVQKKLSVGTGYPLSEIDDLVMLVEEISDFVQAMRTFRMIDYTAQWNGTTNDPIYSPDHLSGLRQFTSVLTLTLSVFREIE